ncbi:MAG: aminotransferase class V-fold PLP-dependent enzyme [Gemmatimonadetes bacterium]|nr:aminotransferase class V-fold PLP-dependent enzyme [Gemmatimonadota bacterium]
MSTESDDLRARLRALERAARPLEPGATRRRELRRATVASTERFLRHIATARAYDDVPDPGIGLLESPVTEHGMALPDLIERFEREVVKPGGNPASAGYLAYIPGGGLYHSALGDFLAAVSDKYAGIFFAGPGAVRLENQLLRWAADLVGYPAGAAGNIASGGSIANLAAVVTARDAHGLRGADYARAVVYGTGQAHHSLPKALRIAGLAEATVREVALDEHYRMRADALAAAIAADRAAGLRPWLVLAAAGSTDTGAVDPLADIADVAQRQGCWLHVDAAYGGFFLLTAYGRALMRGIERADSVVLDPHKGLFLPYGAGMVLVRDGALLAAAHSYTGNYMQDAADARAEASPADLSPELSKHFRGPRLWLPLMLLGVAPFRAALEEKLLLAQYFHREVQALGFAVGPEPDLSVVTYRWAPRGVPLEEQNRLNQRIVEGVRHDGRVFISSTMLDGRFTLRLAVLAFRSHLRIIDRTLQVLQEQLAALD